LRFFEFCKIRLLRLYPLYLVGFILGTLPLLLNIDLRNLYDINIFLMWCSGLFLLPYFGEYSGQISSFVTTGSTFPFNAPAWSLFFELFSNIIFYLYVYYFRAVSIFKWLFVFFITYLISILYFGVHSGYSQANFLGGFPRVLFNFFLGFIIFQYHEKLPRFTWMSMIFFILVILVAFNFGNIYIILFILFFASPIVVVVGCRIVVNPESLLGRLLIWLGKISFPLYITHYAIFAIFQPIFDMLHFVVFYSVVLQALFAILASHFFIELEPKVRELVLLIFYKKYR